MDYNKIIELNNVTLEDCTDLFFKKDIITIINDGHIVNLQKKGGK